MDEIISKLIAVDKEARKRVSKAKKEAVAAMGDLSAKKAELEAQNEAVFRQETEKRKSESDALVLSKKQEIEQKSGIAIAALDERLKADFLLWADKITAQVLADE